MTPKPEIAFVVTGLDGQSRLDQLLRHRFPSWGRQAVQRLIAGRQVQVNERTVWLASWLVSNHDHITVRQAPAAKPAPFTHFEEAWLLAADADLVVVNKPAGLLSEAPPHRDAPNLRDLAIARFGVLTLFHRLDRDTSGVVLMTRTTAMNRLLAAAFQAHTVGKHYVAVVQAPNRLDVGGVINTRLAPHPHRHDLMAVVAKGGQTATTRYAVLGTMDGRQLVGLWPETGRTHQLRVHMALMGAPILGDRLYGDQAGASRLLLHAYQITVPVPDAAPRTLVAPLPPEFVFSGVVL